MRNGAENRFSAPLHISGEKLVYHHQELSTRL